MNCHGKLATYCRSHGDAQAQDPGPATSEWFWFPSKKLTFTNNSGSHLSLGQNKTHTISHIVPPNRYMELLNLGDYSEISRVCLRWKRMSAMFNNIATCRLTCIWRLNWKCIPRLPELEGNMKFQNQNMKKVLIFDEWRANFKLFLNRSVLAVSLWQRCWKLYSRFILFTFRLRKLFRRRGCDEVDSEIRNLQPIVCFRFRFRLIKGVTNKCPSISQVGMPQNIDFEFLLIAPTVVVNKSKDAM